MEINLVVIAKLHIIRQSLTQKLKPLGYNVHAFSDAQELLKHFSLISPDVIIMDGDGEEKTWKLLLLGLKKIKKRIFFILMISKISIDQANQAISLGISGIILKPFNPVQHIRKISEIILEQHSIQMKREFPRFYFGTNEKVAFKYFDTQTKEMISFIVINLSQRGALLHLIYPATKDVLQPGYRIPEGKLSLGTMEFSISSMVVHNRGNEVGILIEEVHNDKNLFYKYIDTRYTNIFGTTKVKGKW